MTVIIHNMDTYDYFEVTYTKCYELESKLNASRYVDRWNDLGDKLYRAASRKLDFISIPNHQYIFLKEALGSSIPTPSEIKPLRKEAFDDDKFSPKFEWITKSEDKYKDVPRYDLGSKRVIGFFIPFGV
jgi:hypothetical protein